MEIVNRFGLWYLVTLAPAVLVFWLALQAAPWDRPLAEILAAVITTGLLPVVAMSTIAASVALRVNTESFLPRWYRRMFGHEEDR